MTKDQRRAAERLKFEAWVEAMPYDKPIDRQAEGFAWPGQYHDYTVQCMWEAWCEALGIDQGAEAPHAGLC